MTASNTTRWVTFACPPTLLGAQTQRSTQTFGIGGHRMPTEVIRFWCIKGAQSEESQRFDVRIDHGVSALSQIVRKEVPTRGRPGPNENWCLWILCASSIPAIVTAALANDLKPRMGRHLCLIAR